MASGLALGFMFFSGSLGVLAVGYIADQIGLSVTLQFTAGLAVVAFVARNCPLGFPPAVLVG